MSQIKPTKAQMFNGLRRRPKYEEISQEINPDKTKVIYPNRDARLLREDPRMTQLDGLGMFESMQEQQEAVTKEQRKETIIQEIAKDEGIGVKEVKAREKEPEVFQPSPPPPPPPPPPPSQPEVFNMAATDHPFEEHEQAIYDKREMMKRMRRTKKR